MSRVVRGVGVDALGRSLAWIYRYPDLNRRTIRRAAVGSYIYIYILCTDFVPLDVVPFVF